MTSDPTAFEEWSALTDEQRAEVSELARQRKPHPDPRVRRAARRWATVLLESHRPRPSRIRRFGASLSSWIWVLETGYMDEVKKSDQEAWAKRVLAANPPE